MIRPAALLGLALLALAGPAARGQQRPAEIGADDYLLTQLGEGQ